MKERLFGKQYDICVLEFALTYLNLVLTKDPGPLEKPPLWLAAKVIKTCGLKPGYYDVRIEKWKFCGFTYYNYKVLKEDLI